MKLMELDQNNLTEARMVWARKGNQIVRKYRCTTGPRKGRRVSNPAQCAAPVNLKKRLNMKKTRARQGPRLARKARRTKRINPHAKMVARMNRAQRG